MCDKHPKFTSTPEAYAGDVREDYARDSRGTYGVTHMEFMEGMHIKHVPESRMSAQTLPCPGVSSMHQQATSTRQVDVRTQSNSMYTGHTNSISSMLAAALDSLADRLSSRDNLPRILPDTFEGDVPHFPHWEQSFSAMVDGTCSPSQKLYYVSKLVVAVHGRQLKAISH